MWRWTVMTMLRETAGETAKGALAAWSEQRRGVPVDAVHRQAISKIRLRFES